MEAEPRLLEATEGSRACVPEQHLHLDPAIDDPHRPARRRGSVDERLELRRETRGGCTRRRFVVGGDGAPQLERALVRGGFTEYRARALLVERCGRAHRTPRRSIALGHPAADDTVATALR